MGKIHEGTPWPLGSTITPRGVNFSIVSPKAEIVELLIFSNANSTSPEQIFPLSPELHRSGDYWHAEIEGIGEGYCYSYRLLSQTKGKDSQEKIFLDPCARAISGWEKYKRDFSKPNNKDFSYCLKGVVCERDNFDFNKYPRPKHSWNKSIIYELHVGGFTSNPKSNVSKSSKGTFLALIEKIPYLLDLGITTIELLPVFSFDPYDAPNGQRNYWGYSPLNWFTPHHEFTTDNDPLKARKEFRKLVESCHENGLEVILDVVYNHTTEGGKDGPSISWKGFGDSLYYYQDKKGDYQDVSGCGNSIAANRPLVRHLILESMRCWATELGVDGFRFDLGVALSRGEDLCPLPDPPLFQEIESDPQLSQLKLISEPWDCGGLYLLSDFPASHITTWNGHFRDDLRKFWKGEKHSAWRLKDRLRGSQDLYKKKNSHEYSINFITAHDGFTLHDLVSYSSKHNLANGENNRDGENHNNSWNHGIEGPSTDLALSRLRNRQKKNLLSCLLLSPGIPMLLMGDEVGRSQGGNNNSWCQNNQLGWMIWEGEKCDFELHKFVKTLLKIRKQLPELFTPKTLPYEGNLSGCEESNDLFIRWHGVKVNKPDWGHWSHTIGYSIDKKGGGSVMWIGLNAYSKSMIFELPNANSPWEIVINTAVSHLENLAVHSDQANQKTIEVESRSLVLMVTREYAARIDS